MKRMKKRIAAVTAVLMICTMLLGTTAQAGQVLSDFGKAISGTKKIAITKPKKPISVYVGAYDGTVTVKSSKSSIVKCGRFTESVTLDDGSKVPVYGVKLTANKEGKTKVTVTYKHSGGTVTKSVTLYAYKWTNPFKTLMIGKKKFNSVFKNTNERIISPMKGKLNIKMNSKFKSLRVYYQAKGANGFRSISKTANVNLKSGDLLLFRFTDNKHRVTNAEALFRVR